jgi:hypothetical protein
MCEKPTAHCLQVPLERDIIGKSGDGSNAWRARIENIGQRM